MFSQPSRRFEFGSGRDPWFRIGTVDIGSAAIVAMAIVAGMLLYAIEGPSHELSLELIFDGSGRQGGDIAHGQIWRLLTWFIPDRPAIWPLISAAVLFFLGSQIERVLGKKTMAWFLLVTVLIPSVIALLLYSVGLPLTEFLDGQLVSSAVFYTFIAYMPGVKFYFGIPGWVFAAVFFVIEALASLADRRYSDLYFLFIRVGAVLVTAKAFGLANGVEWIPDIRPALSRLPFGNSSHGGPARSGPGYSGPASGRPSGGQRPGKSKGRKWSSDSPVVGVDASFEEMGIDEILDQISAFGMDSLNKAQKKKLEAYSKGRNGKDGHGKKGK